MGSELIVGIATVTRYDLLRESIARLASGTLRPDRIILIDNGGQFEDSFGSCVSIEIVRPPYNLGVAASWNEIYRRADGDVVILNDDVFVGPQTLERMLATPGLLVSPIAGREFSCFLQRRELWDRIGLYDEGFWPAYHEDQDYRRRMKLQRLTWETISSDGINHVVGATGYTYEPSKRFMPFVLRRYACKWGGAEFNEVFERPWDGHPEAWDDLEENYRYLSALQRDVEGSSCMETLRDLAADCVHVTDLGCGSGFSTTALLAARPETLVAIDLSQQPLLANVFRLARLYTKTDFAFRQAVALAVDLELTDLLLIDAALDVVRFSEQLEKLATAVRKRIVAHNTSRNNCSRIIQRTDLLETIQLFLSRHREWEVHPHHQGASELTVLERRE